MRVKIPLQKISDPVIAASGIDLFVLRLDMTHPHISGNKWYKLKYNLKEAKRQKKETLLTFGGAYSNHIAAAASAGREFGFKTIGIIRGEELRTADLTHNPSPKERGTKGTNHTLRFATDCGMQLHFVSREEYRKKDSAESIDSLRKQFGDFYLLPEGGTNDLAIKGCAEILALAEIPFDFVCCPVGTGGTLAGVISSLKEDQKALGFSVLKGAEFLEQKVQKLIISPLPPPAGDIVMQYHFGGYGKHTPQLLKFIEDFEKQNNISLEHVYTGKMMFGIYDLIKGNHFLKNSTVIAIHTGGLQGKLHQHSPV
ncbi:MAG: 1-aminocyclopropane-1-carboxylate deaminase/D-cysteine desulfhydrase [Bacteroidetes bacterium]|nr:MAG: 1-aminocyclopropane-1-carboxylate deaminase/D-cysteine desulfhydrase [Bacteroidota bacterium]